MINWLLKLRELPEEKKKIILWAIVSVTGALMGYFWITGAVKDISKAQFNDIKMPQVDTSGFDALKNISNYGGR